MSLYADYLKERTEDRIIESDTGFVTYRYLNDGRTVYIVDIYVVPDARRDGAASVMADMVAAEAKAKGATEMLGTVQPSARGATTSVKVLLGYGMKLKSAGDNYIVFSKEI